MDTNKILQADVLDILFDNRNKAYGAYELRKNYHKRLRKAMLIAGFLFFTTVTVPVVASMMEKPNEMVDKPRTICEFPNIELPIVEPKVIPQSEPPKENDISTEKFTSEIKIVKPIEVKEDDKLPSNEDLENKQSGTDNHAGNDTGNVNLPNSNGTDDGKVVIPEVLETQIEKEIYEETDLEVMPEYPGGEDELMKYLANQINYPARAISANKEGRVVLGFVVNQDGEIEDVKVDRGLGYGCDEEALRVVKSMPRWKAGKFNGKAVKVYYNLPITFKLEN